MEQKPTIFVGSSSEGLEAARMVNAHLAGEFLPYRWNNGLFLPGYYTLETLEGELKKRNFAVIVATPDDPIIKRGEAFDGIRDNLLLELGLFMGAMGRHRAFLMVPAHKKLSIPSDLAGLTHIRYDAERFQGGYADKANAIQTACMDLRAAIQTSWGKQVLAREREFKRLASSQALQSIRRLGELIIKLRDVLIVLPTQLLESLSNADKFERVKKTASSRVDEIAALFRDDAKRAGLVPEFEEIVAATKVAVVGIPYPSEVLVTRTEVEEMLKSYGAASAVKLFSGGSLLEQLASLPATIEAGFDRRMVQMATRYDEWWASSKTRIESATEKLSQGLMMASLVIAQSAVNDGATDAPGEFLPGG
jgi:hypothetical protein